MLSYTVRTCIVIYNNNKMMNAKVFEMLNNNEKRGKIIPRASWKQMKHIGTDTHTVKCPIIKIEERKNGMNKVNAA